MMSKKNMIKFEDDGQQDNDHNGNMGVEEEEVEDKKQKRAAGGTARRAAGGGAGSGGSGGVNCQAEKCTVDLTDAKRYHRRHKVCEFHAKAPYVIVYGVRQRFCQQCSRFHELSEFDDTKRSCRRRLAGHNERRRKSCSEPQAEGGSSSRTKATANPQCRPADHERGNRAQISSYATESPTCKPFQIR